MKNLFRKTCNLLLVKQILMKKRIVWLFGSLVYFGWNYHFVGLRPEHVGL